MDVGHDGTQTLVYFFGRPLQTHAVLRHLETGSSYAAGIGRLTRAIENLCALEQSNRFRRRRHVCAFGHAETTVLEQVLCIGFLYLVLGRTGHRDVARDLPRTLAGEVLGLRELSRILFDTSATHILQFEHIVELLFVETLGIVDEAVAIAQRQHFGSEAHGLLCRKLRYVSCAGDTYALAFETLSAGSEHRLCEITCAVARCFRTHEATAPVLTFTRQGTRELIAQALVLTEHKADLATAHTDIAGRHVGVCTDMTLKLRHKTLAETHHLGVTLAARREVRTTLGATHRQGRQRVLKRLLEGQELHNTEVHARVETDTTFIRTDSAIHLNAETAVDLHLALIVHPRHAEHDHALGFYDALHHFLLTQIRVCHDHRSYTLYYFANSLVKLLLARVFTYEVRHKSVHPCLCLLVHKAKKISFLFVPNALLRQITAQN